MRGAAVASLALLAASACGGGDAPLPEMATISDFTLLDQRGEEFRSRELRGKVWVADLIFTSCPSICPLMSTQMANLARRVDRDDVRFVSITVDPEVDTPEVLRGYAARYRADPERWVFLTGSPDDVRRVIRRSFLLPMGGRLEGEDGRYDILHTGRFLLIDRGGTLRGLYDTDGPGLERLERDIERLLRGSA